MKRLELNVVDLKVESFVTLAKAKTPNAEQDYSQWKGTSDYCDTENDCSLACIAPTNVCAVCG